MLVEVRRPLSAEVNYLLLALTMITSGQFTKCQASCFSTSETQKLLRKLASISTYVEIQVELFLLHEKLSS